ncbi:DUF481 domain-containing protein [Alterisphingorhabdus coralli]|uniref:DUF481 domain-containing protein n=1 Tax=Alterisphingorhabdus coralli TaxID=3071408 RepID=A0AA97F3V6_9SPHN|nr:DUF481 domain-containing protein [Parasphingorhabdus sp. SCSIO 66989]WOE73809.1 DUF481 domain-containing protein [Parasphingorhabdus sp. SCSIO 66989]
MFQKSSKGALCAALIASTALVTPQMAYAEVPESVKALIDQAIADKDDSAVETVIGLAKKTNPEDSAALDAMLSEYQSVRLAEKEAEEAAAEAERLANNGLFDNWSGQGEIGGFRSTGNTSNTGITGSLKLQKQGKRWRHNLTALVDFQRTEGVSTREQFLFAYEPNVQFTDRLYGYGLAQYERDRFQGFSARYTLSGGLGYRFLTGERMTLDVKGGPAYRQVELVGGGSNSQLAALAALDFDWQVVDNIKLTQDAEAYIASGNSTLRSITGLEAALSSALTARVSYTVEHETDPPVGSVATDTLTRFTLIYGF